jgi:hypothetical protein
MGQPSACPRQDHAAVRIEQKPDAAIVEQWSYARAYTRRQVGQPSWQPQPKVAGRKRALDPEWL